MNEAVTKKVQYPVRCGGRSVTLTVTTISREEHQLSCSAVKDCQGPCPHDLIKNAPKVQEGLQGNR